MSQIEIKAGDVIAVRYPFVHCVAEAYDGEGGICKFDSWRPGTFAEGEDPYGGSWRAMADAAGQMILTVVSVHKPGKYPTRVFYTREWVNPNGKRFGKRALRMCTVEKFGRLARGYRAWWGVRDRPRDEWVSA